MRLWSIHPKYLDQKGLVAVWRETLLAKNVLQGKTKGYKNHPQLQRFKKTKSPLLLINTYLLYVWKESKKRDYNFNKKKLGKTTKQKIYTTTGQIEYEFGHLKKKLKTRNIPSYLKLKKVENILPNPLFKIKTGNIEKWERYKK